MGLISMVVPKTKPILAMLAPIALPSVKSFLSFIDEIKAVKISGVEVPRATIVNPMINGEHFKRIANPEEPTTT